MQFASPDLLRIITFNFIIQRHNYFDSEFYLTSSPILQKYVKLYKFAPTNYYLLKIIIKDVLVDLW